MQGYLYLSQERIEMLLKLNIPDPELVKTLEHHLARYTEQDWITLRVRFGLRSRDAASSMFRWCNEHFGDRNMIDRRWYVATDHKTKLYRHIRVAFRYPADQMHFKIYWHDNLWEPKVKEA
jgi:hypothetical protein